MGGAGAELGGLLRRAAGLQTRCQSTLQDEGREGKWVVRGRERRSCLPVAILNREYQKCFDLYGGDVCSACH